MSYFEELKERANAVPSQLKKEEPEATRIDKPYYSSVKFGIEKLIRSPKDQFLNMKPYVELTVHLPEGTGKEVMKNVYLSVKKEVNLLLAEAEAECLKILIGDARHEAIARKNEQLQPPPANQYPRASSQSDDF